MSKDSNSFSTSSSAFLRSALLSPITTPQAAPAPAAPPALNHGGNINVNTPSPFPNIVSGIGAISFSPQSLIHGGNVAITAPFNSQSGQFQSGSVLTPQTTPQAVAAPVIPFRANVYGEYPHVTPVRIFVDETSTEGSETANAQESSFVSPQTHSSVDQSLVYTPDTTEDSAPSEQETPFVLLELTAVINDEFTNTILGNVFDDETDQGDSESDPDLNNAFILEEGEVLNCDTSSDSDQSTLGKRTSREETDDSSEEVRDAKFQRSDSTDSVSFDDDSFIFDPDLLSGDNSSFDSLEA